MSRRLTIPKPAFAARALILLAATASLGACMTTPEPNTADTAAFRMARYEEMQRVQDFEQCQQEGLTLDAEARARASTGAFLNAARVLERCIDDVSASADAVQEDQRMRVHALATVDYFKGGDVEAARRSLDRFKSDHPGNDLYFGNGSSFTETAETLLGQTEDFRLGQFAALNVDTTVKKEIRRINYWKNR